MAARDGGPCFRCHHRLTLPGLVLNCRESLPEAAVYAAALARQQPQVLEGVDRFVVPSRYAAGQVARLGLPADRVSVIPHYLPEEAFAERSVADEGGYALVAARLSVEKGIDTAIEAAADSRGSAAGRRRRPGRGRAGRARRPLGRARGAVGRLDRAALPASWRRRHAPAARRATTSSPATRRSRRWRRACR